MPTSRHAVLGAVALGFGLAGAALTPPPAWADGGKGFLTRTAPIVVEDDEDGASQPENFGTTYTFGPQLSYGSGLNFRYGDKGEDSAPTTYRLNSPYAGVGLKMKLKLRFDFRSLAVDEEDKGEEPFTLGSSPRLRYRFNTWTSQSVLDAWGEEDDFWDDDEGTGIKFPGGPEARRAWREFFDGESAREAVRTWLGDEGFDSLQDQFGHEGAANGGAASGGATNVSTWITSF